MSKPCILIVEDNKIIAREIQDRLISLDYDVCGVVYSGEDAVISAGSLMPDLILMDIKLSGMMDGIEAAEKIKYLYNIPVIYLTAYTDKETLERAKHTEPYGYIVKPMEERELHSAIEITMYKHGMEKKLEESEAKYRSIVSSFEGYIYINDKDFNLQYVNPKLKEMLRLGETTGKCHRILHGNDTPCSWCKLEDVMKGVTAKSEVRCFENNRWYYYICSPVILSRTEVSHQAIIFDIHEQKETEQNMVRLVKEKELMLGELHHRVKNNLQLIMSILSLQRNRISAEELSTILVSSQNRVKTIALIENEIFKSVLFNQVVIDKFVQHLGSYLKQVYSYSRHIKLVCETSRVELTIDSAIPCALILYELISNCFKHAFTGKDNGEVLVVFKKAEGNAYVLSVKDNGIGLPDGFNDEDKRNIGLSIVKYLSNQLHGNLKINGKSGTEIYLKFEAPHYKPRL